jgi:hypothetical protein
MKFDLVLCLATAAYAAPIPGIWNRVSAALGNASKQKRWLKRIELRERRLATWRSEVNELDQMTGPNTQSAVWNKWAEMYRKETNNNAAFVADVKKFAREKVSRAERAHTKRLKVENPMQSYPDPKVGAQVLAQKNSEPLLLPAVAADAQRRRLLGEMQVQPSSGNVRRVRLGRSQQMKLQQERLQKMTLPQLKSELEKFETVLKKSDANVKMLEGDVLSLRNIFQTRTSIRPEINEVYIKWSRKYGEANDGTQADYLSQVLRFAEGKLELAERNLKNQKTYYSLLRMEKEGRPLPSQVEEEVHSLGTDFSRNSRKFVLGTTAVGLGAVGVGVMAQNSANPNPNDSFDPHSDHKAVEPPKLGQATNELVEEPVKQSVVEPVQQPVVEPVEQPVKHVKQPVQRVEEPVKQPVVEQFTLPIF